jgi:hypothetical protein
MAARMLIGPDDGYQAGTGRPVIRHSLPYHPHHLVVLASYQPLSLVLTHFSKAQHTAAHHPLHHASFVLSRSQGQLCAAGSCSPTKDSVADPATTKPWATYRS